MIARRSWYFRGRVLKSRQPHVARDVPRSYDKRAPAEIGHSPFQNRPWSMEQIGTNGSDGTGWKLLIGLRHRLLLMSRSSFVRAKGRSFVPARRTSIASRAGAVKAGRRAWLAAGAGVARPRLDRAEHGARITRIGRLHHRSSSARRRVLWPAPPRRSGQACWRARSRARCGVTASWRLRSRI
ncbi:hypothetical protein SAMN05443247_08872 [Bradyrhizobium erythrophlei]|nr:hypothetical protein SAMN05443247_08872 [Bradyrhizobium erythrophlei]